MLPDTDRSDPENDSDSDSGSQQRGCGDDDSSGSESLSEECVSADNLLMSTRTKKEDTKQCSAAGASERRNINFEWVKSADKQHLP